MDIMANMELLHLWFDPIPFIFETTFKDIEGFLKKVKQTTRKE